MSLPGPAPFDDRGSWLPFMCPVCRGLFRTKKSHTGATTCPLCEQSITISLADEKSAKEDDNQPIQPLEKGERRSLHNEQSWDSDSPTAREPSNVKGLILTTFFLITLGVAVGMFFIIQQKNERKVVPLEGLAPDRFDAFNNSDRTSQSIEQSEPLLQVQAPDFERANLTTEKFLSVTSIEEFAPLIRDPDRVMPLLREYYKHTPYEAIGALSIGDHGNVRVSKKIASFQVTLKNYESRLIAVELTDEGALVDWESWVSYCEEPWEDFITNKTKEPKKMRALVTRSFYYNFNFDNDEEWVCFTLTRTPDDSVLYGYLPTDSPLLTELPNSAEPSTTFRIQIRFPEEAVTDNQVLITDVIDQGWVHGL